MPYELRVIDENLNRLGEGLRVLEDIARMLLNDAGLTRQLKAMRHKLIRADLLLNTKLIDARDSANDVGSSMTVSGQRSDANMPDILIANAKRVQESLRVLEELAKLSGIGLNPGKYRQARFTLYTIERNLLSRLTREDKLKKITGLYVVLDTAAIQGLDPLLVTRQVIRGGAKTIQLRDKMLGKRDLLHLAQRLQKICSSSDVLFMINDHLDIALAADADGLHVGQEDLPVTEARKHLPVDKLIGCSATTFYEAIKATADGADYIGLGAIFPTPSKTDIDVCGLKVLKRVAGKIGIPVVAIGGINKSNILKVLAAGAAAAAVISAVLKVEKPEAATRELVGKIND